MLRFHFYDYHCHSENKKSGYPHRGFTMIEVVVAMFLLALGITALILMQTRTLNSVKEAENRLQVSRAVDNLAQGLSIAPYLKISLGPDGYVTNKDYSSIAAEFKDCVNAPPPAENKTGKNSRDEFAATLISRFCAEIKAINGIRAEEMQIKICPQATMSENLAWNFTCGEKGAQTVIKVVWKYRGNEERQTSRGPKTNAPNDTVLSYQIPLAQ